MKTVLLLSSLLCFCSVSLALNVTECYSGEKGVSEIKQEITIGRCKKPPCRLKKGTSVPIEFKFTAALDTPTLFNRVWATIVGVPFPFLGIDGTDACKGIYKEDGETFAGCPIKKGETYKYKNAFEILNIYPKIRLDVHWGLEGESGHVSCFEVGARITN